LNSVLTNSFLPGDVIYVDTGTYGSGTVISNAVAGTNGNPVVIQGSTNYALGGSTFTGSGANLTVRGSYLNVTDLRLLGGTEGLTLNGARYCVFTRVWASPIPRTASNCSPRARTSSDAAWWRGAIPPCACLRKPAATISKTAFCSPPSAPRSASIRAA
jgi:hypothetical protein